MGCALSVKMEGDKVTEVTGNICPRGKAYAEKEVTNPTRIVTTVVRVKDHEMLSVKTKEDIPKEKMMDCVRALKDVCVEAPIHIGDVIVKDVAGTGVDMIATKEIV
jgi:CxxC motif-containing protein